MSWDIVLVTVHAQKALLKAKNLAIFIRETEGKKKKHKVGGGEEEYVFSIV